MGKKADQLQRRFEHRLEEISEQFDEVLALVQQQGEPLAEERAAFEASVRSVRERMAEVQAEMDQSRIAIGDWHEALHARARDLEAEVRARVAEIDPRSADSLVAFESSLVALRERAELRTDEEIARWSTEASGRVDDALRAVDEHADVVGERVAGRTAEVLAAADGAAEVLAGAERTVAEARERAHQCLDDTGVLEAEVRARVAEIDPRSADSLVAFESSLVALRERAELRTDEEIARWSTEASGRVDDALRAVDEHADVVGERVAGRTAEVLAAADGAAEVLAGAERTVAEARERAHQCLDDTGVLEAEVRARVAEIDARSADSLVAFESSLVALRERAELRTDEEIARSATEASERIDGALRSVDDQADAVAGQVARRAAEVLAVAERTVAEAQERARQRLDDSAAFEDEMRARLGEQAEAMAAQVESRVAEILAAAERTVAEAEEHARLRLDHAVASIEHLASETPNDITPSVPVPAEVLEWRARSAIPIRRMRCGNQRRTVSSTVDPHARTTTTSSVELRQSFATRRAIESSRP